MTARFRTFPGGDSAAMRARNPALYGAPADATPRDAPAEPCTDTPKKRKRRSVAHSKPDGTLGDEPKPQTNGEKNRRIREYGVPRGEFIVSMLDATKKEGE